MNFIKKHIVNLESNKVVIFILLLLILIPKKYFIIPGADLEESWKIGLNLAIKQKLLFGKDFIFTYGPLGYLSTTLPIYVSKFAIILYRFFIIINAAYFIHYLFKKIENKETLFFAGSYLLLTGNFLFSTDSLAIYFFFLFHIFHYTKHQNILSLFVASIITLLAFYIKVNTGIILNVLFLIFIFYTAVQNNMSIKKLLAVLASHFILLLFIGYWLKTNILLYIKNSLPIINNFNDSMNEAATTISLLSAVLVIITFVFICLYYAKNILQYKYELFLSFNVFLFLYIIFKQGFVRADLHINLYFIGVNFIFILYYLFTQIDKLKKSISYLILFSTLICLTAFQGNLLDAVKDNNTQPFAKNNTLAENKQKRTLPLNIINKIGKSSVDILTNEISYAYFNDLNYNPRPIPQSYSVYSKNLLLLNAEKYLSVTAPDYLIYQFGSIDTRHPFWDDNLAILSILKKYTINDTIAATALNDKMLLLKKNSNIKTQKEKILLDTIVTANTTIKIPPSNAIVFLYTDIEYTFLGKTLRTLYQVPDVHFKLNYDNNETTVGRLILPVMAQGVPINKKIVNINDAINFFNNNNAANINTNTLEIIINKSDNKYYKPTIRLKFVEIII